MEYMTQQYLTDLKEQVNHRLQEAERILSGDRDNYDGADGARYIQDLCIDCLDLIEYIETQPMTF